MSRVLALVGATGTGKTAFALEAAERLSAEIVAVDAFTVYRGMDVGTAKPSRVERDRVPHHMVDVLEPEQECTVRWFQQRAREAVTEILSRGRIALLVGGSGLYFRAVVDPLAFPPTDATVRAELASRFGDDAAAAHAALAGADPDAATRIEPGNLRRSIRALEVIELTGQPFSTFRRAWDRFRSIYPTLAVVGVHRARDELVRRIDQRVEDMLAGGLLEECAALARRDLSATARQAIGYAEVFEHLAGRRDLDAAAEAIRVRTRRFAARQERWFRADPRVEWAAPDEVVDRLTACGS